MNNDEYKKLFEAQSTPEIVNLVPTKYIVIEKKVLAETSEAMLAVKALYALSVIVMASSKGPHDEEECPLEGTWSLIDKDKGFTQHTNITGNFMLKQSDSVDEGLFSKHKKELLESSQDKDFFEYLKDANLRVIDKGMCVKMLHVGPYSKEQDTFDIMEKFAIANSLKRTNDSHRESYIRDIRTVGPEKFETILKFQVTS